MKTTELIKAEEFIKNNYTLINGNEDYMCNETYKIVGVHEIAEKYAQQRVNEVLEDKIQKGDLFYYSDMIFKCEGISKSGLIKYNSRISISGDDRVCPSLCIKAIKPKNNEK